MKISSHCYALTGLGFVLPWSVNAGFVVGTGITLVIDTGATTLAAQTIYGYAHAVRMENRLQVINTEQHLDHLGGNGYFHDQGCDIYGHASIMRSQAELIAAMDEFDSCIENPVRRQRQESRIFYTRTHIVNPNLPIHRDTSIFLGDVEARVLLTPGHTRSNLSVFLPADGVIFCGDCLVNGYLPNLEAGTREDWQIWLSSLDKIAAQRPQIVVPGHGDVLCGSEITEAIQHTQQILQEAIALGKAPTLIDHV